MQFVQIKPLKIKKSTNKLRKLHGKYIPHFKNKTRNVSKQALKYLNGQLVIEGKGNMTKYAKNVPDCDNQSLQHFISNSPWDERPVILDIQRDVTKLIGDEKNGAMHIDECSFPKEGKNSVGVKRQYCGRLGKVENCQVGVFLGYTNKCFRTLIDEQLYLPKDWIEDKKRREKCGVPTEMEFKTKAELGWEMIKNAKENKVPFGWIGMDSFYGRQPDLLDKIDNDYMTYIADIPCDTHVWLTLPKTEVPKRKGRRGPIPKKEKLVDGEPTSLEVKKVDKHLEKSRWKRVFLRDTERKELWSKMVALRVCPVRDGLPGKEVWLVIRKDEGEKRTKYQLSNAPPNTSIKRLAQMSCSRYWIERALEDAKGVGLADYQLRGWRGWHHHMVMTMLAMLFLLMCLVDWVDKAPILTLQDVKEILEVILPREEITAQDIIKLIENKHKARYSARKSHHKRSNPPI